MIASGINGTCTWTIDDTGLLLIKPTNNVSGVLHNPSNFSRAWDWMPYSNKILNVKINSGVSIGDDVDPIMGGYTSTRECNYMFRGLPEVVTIDLSGLSTDMVSNMSYMFSNCPKLVSITFGSLFNTENVLDIGGMFYSCTSLTSLDLSRFNTTKINCDDWMFYDCGLLTSITISETYIHGPTENLFSNFVIYGAANKNNNNGIIVMSDKDFYNLSAYQRAGVWSRGIGTLAFSLNAYRSLNGEAASDGTDASFNITWATSVGTDRILTIYSKLSNEPLYNENPVLSHNFSGNSGINVLTIPNITDEAWDYKVTFTDGTNTWITFPSLNSNIQLLKITDAGDVYLNGGLYVPATYSAGVDHKPIELFIKDYFILDRNPSWPNADNGWVWTKFRDGTCKMEYMGTVSASISQKTDYVYESLQKQIEYPFGLTRVSSFNINYGQGTYPAWIGRTVATTTKLYFYLMASLTRTAQDHLISIKIEGSIDI